MGKVPVSIVPDNVYHVNCSTTLARQVGKFVIRLAQCHICVVEADRSICPLTHGIPRLDISPAYWNATGMVLCHR